MSTRRPQPPAETYVELLLAGAEEACRGLVAGLRLGTGESVVAIAGLDDELEKPSLGERLRELIDHQDALSHLVISARFAALLRGQSERLAEAGLRLVAEQPVASAAFAFSLHVFTRTQAEPIRALLAALPAGARLEDYSEREQVDAGAAGVEVYSSVHDYELKGKGRVAGRVDAVIATRRLLAAQPLVDVERIELELD